MKSLKKIFILLAVLGIFAQGAFAAKFSDDMKDFIKKQFPGSTLRFDGLISMPDGTNYLPLYPALVKNPQKIQVAKTISTKKQQYPEIIILNNDYAFLKVIKNEKGKKSLYYMQNPPVEIKTGLLPQDLLVPSGLYIPENIKSIIGNLEIPTEENNGLRISPYSINVKKAKNIEYPILPILKNKMFYISSCHTKDIQVLKAGNTNSSYALEQKSIVYDMKATPDKRFLLVTNFNKTTLEIISIADDRVIKQIDLTSNGGDILIDKTRNYAYISSPDISTLFVLDLSTMNLKQKIKLKGKCTKFVLTDNDRKIFYFSKDTKEIWSLELDNDYITKYIGSFPNVSKIEFSNGNVYLISRIGNRIASVDYQTLNLMSEQQIGEKPTDMLLYKNKLYIVSAGKNAVQVFDTTSDKIITTINLNTKGFSTKIYKIDNSNIAIIIDAAANLYSVINLDTNTLVKNYDMNTFASKLVIIPEIKKN